ncbi:5'-nucleotidase [Egicoccus sp. AB-alg2]|uniref:5'-nucleotidase n=1 Tax=Egicoccus sp. AB-alg2 TaxID=3242693 RepID=UPI00359DD5AB
MPYDLADKLVVGISSRALFDLDEAHRIFETEGLAAYREHQTANEDEPLAAGTALPLVRGLLRINELADEALVEVLIISRNNADTGLRVMNSVEHHGLEVPRWAFTDGTSAGPYLREFSCDLFLSANEEDVAGAMQHGVAAARILRVPDEATDEIPSEVRIAFDGDAVLFSAESEAIYRAGGLDAFLQHEEAHADQPLSPGPLQPFLRALSRIQQRFPEADNPLRMSLVTARNAPAHKRVIRTLRSWGIHLNETFYLGGLEKAGVLRVLRPHIFFDDQSAHLEPARSQTPAAQVPAEYRLDPSRTEQESTQAVTRPLGDHPSP